MIVLGLATMGTSAACLVRDGTIVAAIEEERLSRIKNDGAFPLRAIAECLRLGGVIDGRGRRGGGLLAAVAASGRGCAARSARRWARGAALASIARRSRVSFRGGVDAEHPEAGGRWSDLFRVRRILGAAFGVLPRRDRLLRPPPHAPALRRGAARLAGLPVAQLRRRRRGGLDGADAGRGRAAHRSQAHRLAELARAFLQLLHRLPRLSHARGRVQDDGPRALRRAGAEGPAAGEGAAAGAGRRLPARHPARPTTTGRWRASFAPELAALVGPPRAPDATPTEGHLALAASVQAAFEAAQRHLLAWAKARHPAIDRLVLSGGCALNVTANGRILQSGLFAEIIAPPAPHDAGCAVGAALAHLAARGLPAAPANVASPYLGPAFDDAEIAAAFAGLGLPEPRRVDEDDADRGRGRDAGEPRHRRLAPGPDRVRAAGAGVALDPRRPARRRDPRGHQRQDQEARAVPAVRALDNARRPAPASSKSTSRAPT